MTTDEEDFDDNERLRAEILRRARTEGVSVAYESALAVCRDAGAPAAAKASSQRTLLMVGGLLNRADRDAGAEKELSEMSPAELTSYLSKLRRAADRRSGPAENAFD